MRLIIPNKIDFREFKRTLKYIRARIVIKITQDLSNSYEIACTCEDRILLQEASNFPLVGYEQRI